MKRVYNPVTSIDGEQWREIEGYPMYRVSSLGRVHSLYHDSLLEWKQYGKRPVVFLSNGGKRWLVDRPTLVMFAFVGKKPKGYWIIHKDFDSDNDILDNLSYVDNKEYGEHNHRRNLAVGRRKGYDRKQAILARREAKRNVQREFALKVLAGEMTLRQVGKLLGITESGACRMVKRLNNG